MSDTLDLEAIKARCEAATPGPWQRNEAIGDERKTISAPATSQYALGMFWSREKWEARGSTFDAGANAAFAAAARTDIPALVAEVERLRVAYAAKCDEFRLFAEAVMEVIDTTQARVLHDKLAAIEEADHHEN